MQSVDDYRSSSPGLAARRGMSDRIDDNVKLEKFKQIKDKSSLTAFDTVSTYTDGKLKELNASKSAYNMMLGLIDC